MGVAQIYNVCYSDTDAEQLSEEIMMADEAATSRIPLTPTTYQELKDFRSGLDETYDAAILMLLRSVRKKGEDAFSAGRRLRAELSQLKKEKS